jgi:uncharacterized protein DUF2330
MKRLGLLSLASIGLVAAPRGAHACGGFFCDPGPTYSTVINQNAERIAFVRTSDTVTAFIQIRYQGDPVDFAWVVPVVSRPELDVADPALFDAIDGATAPQFIFPGQTFPPPNDGCGVGCGGMASERAMAGGDAGDGDADGDGVTVWGQENVGPYETAVITADDPSDLTTWLGGHSYQIPPEAEGIIAEYVQQGSFFVAIRLQADAGLDLLQPLKITYQGTEPCIPLRLTQIAATPDMGVLVWIVSDDQAVPYNYARTAVDDAEVVLNPDGTTNYLDLLSAAVDGVGGRGFVTEFAQPTATIPDLSQASGNPYYGYTTGSPQAEEIVRSGAYLTRLYTQMDPQEMSVDPIFTFDPDQADVSNIHDFRQASAAAGIGPGRARYAALGTVLPLALALFWTGRRARPRRIAG